MPPDPTANEAAIAADLVGRIAAGDAAAEGQLVERYSRGVVFLLRRLSGRPELADDLHQETFRVVLERLRRGGLEEPERLAGFIRRTARNLFLGAWRKAARRRTDDGDALPDVLDPAPSQLERALLDEETRQVLQTLTELRPRDRDILHRFYLAEEPKATICRELALSDLHFNRVLFRARQRLKELLERASKRRASERRASERRASEHQRLEDVA